MAGELIGGLIELAIEGVAEASSSRARIMMAAVV
jgi:hypothetical protein